MSTEKKDTRIPYGARCSWWGTMDMVGSMMGRSGHGIPVCPHCGGVLFEVASEKVWWEGVRIATAAGKVPADYKEMIEFGKGKCFPNYEQLRIAFDKWKKETSH